MGATGNVFDHLPTCLPVILAHTKGHNLTSGALNEARPSPPCQVLCLVDASWPSDISPYRHYQHRHYTLFWRIPTSHQILPGRLSSALLAVFLELDI